MTCCHGPCAAAAHFNPKKADGDLRRYQRHGPDASTRMLLAELRRWPLEGLRLLDVGGGIGMIAAELSGAGLASVTLADASAGYLEAARRHFVSSGASRGGSGAVQFFLGDFAAMADSLPEADIVTLDLWSVVTRMWKGCCGERLAARATWWRSPILGMCGTCAPAWWWKTYGIGCGETRFARSCTRGSAWLPSWSPPDLSALRAAAQASSGRWTSTVAPDLRA
jgi:hypothetical protein